MKKETNMYHFLEFPPLCFRARSTNAQTAKKEHRCHHRPWLELNTQPPTARLELATFRCPFLKSLTR